MPEDEGLPFEQLDFLYMPSIDVPADLDFLTGTLGGRVIFAIEGMGTRVAAVELAPDSPTLLLTDHLDDERPILVYRVADLQASLATLEARGWQRSGSFEIPQGPCCSFRSPGGHRVALYQLTRPDVAHHFDGRRVF